MVRRAEPRAATRAERADVLHFASWVASSRGQHDLERSLLDEALPLLERSLESLDAASERLRNFIARAAQATLVGEVFDDAATGQGLLNFFLRALNCGAVREEEIGALTGLTLDELHSASFVKIVQGRR